MSCREGMVGDCGAVAVGRTASLPLAYAKAGVASARLCLLRKLRWRLAGDLAEGVGKRRDAGIAEVGGELLDRDIGIRRQFFDRSRNARALAPGLEAQLRLRRRQPRKRHRRGAER